jgi:hypothetical protein
MWVSAERYTTESQTKHTGIPVNEHKVRAVGVDCAMPVRLSTRDETPTKKLNSDNMYQYMRYEVRGTPPLLLIRTEL